MFFPGSPSVFFTISLDFPQFLRRFSIGFPQVLPVFLTLFSPGSHKDLCSFSLGFPQVLLRFSTVSVEVFRRVSLGFPPRFSQGSP